MNRIITTAACILASLIVVNGAPAQKHAVRVDIPFDFSASGTQLPAGSYTIATQNDFTSITQNSTGKTTFVSAIPVTDNLPNDSKLVFSVYRDQYFLRKILCPGLNVSLEFLLSKPELKARLQTVNNSGD